MSVDLKKVVIGLPDEVHAAMKIDAGLKDQDISVIGRDILTKHYLGELHGIKLTAARFARAAKLGNSG